VNRIKLIKGVSPVMGEFIMFHDKALIIIIFISLLVGGVLVFLIRKKFGSVVFVEHNVIEFF
jgi:hypothetical protein